MKIPKRFYVLAGTLVCGSLLIVDLVFGTLLFHFCPQLSWNLCSTLASQGSHYYDWSWSLMSPTIKADKKVSLQEVCSQNLHHHNIITDTMSKIPACITINTNTTSTSILILFFGLFEGEAMHQP